MQKGKLNNYYLESFVENIRHKDKIIIFGAGPIGKKLYDMLEENEIIVNVICFCDNDEKIIGREYEGKIIEKPENAFKKFPDACFAVTVQNCVPVINQLILMGVSVENIVFFNFAQTGFEYFYISQYYNYYKPLKKMHSDKLKKFKNIYCNERCFIIGNGPSLRIEDLDKLKNEKTFAANKIYDLYKYTKWRPSFYCASDILMVEQIKDEFDDIARDAENIFLPIVEYSDYILRSEKLNLFELKYIPFYPNMPKFSENIDEQVFEGWTITYNMLQIAVYMGFKKIYLLGVDHNYSIEKKFDGSIIKNDCLSDHAKGMEEIKNHILDKRPPEIYKFELSYKSAKAYGDANGIEIYNATRGGKLEIFPRIDFDSLF